MPTKLSNGKYKTNLRYPKKFREITGTTSEKYQKTFPTRQLAIKAENDMKKKISNCFKCIHEIFDIFYVKAYYTINSYYWKIVYTNPFI